MLPVVRVSGGKFPLWHTPPTTARGVFWAARDANDLPRVGTLHHADAAHLVRHGDLWVGDVCRPGSWTQVRSQADLPKFRKQWTCVDGVDRLTITPFMPQFFWVPRTARGKKLMRQVA